LPLIDIQGENERKKKDVEQRKVDRVRDGERRERGGRER